MNQMTENNQGQVCPRCDNHCPVDALRCGKGRKYFGVTGGEDKHEHKHDHGCGHKRLGGLPGLLHQCGRFVRHAGLGEDELFQALTVEEKAALQTLLEKLCADWRARLGEEAFSRCCHHKHEGKKHHHKHEGHDK